MLSKKGNKDDRDKILNVLNKINITDKLDDDDFKYRIGERLRADF